jgi:molybdopterin-biosynthesis enzyme MoeA-like protein
MAIKTSMINLRDEIKGALGKHPGAWIWFALVAVVCIFSGNLGVQTDDLSKASDSAARAVQWSLGDDKQWGKLRTVMTKEAFAKAAEERDASGLGRAIAIHGDQLKTKAWSVERSERPDSWTIKGFATASMSENIKQDPQWQGAWAARLERQSDGAIKIVKIKMASLPSGATLDPRLLSGLSE